MHTPLRADFLTARKKKEHRQLVLFSRAALVKNLSITVDCAEKLGAAAFAVI